MIELFKAFDASLLGLNQEAEEGDYLQLPRGAVSGMQGFKSLAAVGTHW